MERLVQASPRFLGKPDKLDARRHSYGILFIMQYFLTLKNGSKDCVLLDVLMSRHTRLGTTEMLFR